MTAVLYDGSINQLICHSSSSLYRVGGLLLLPLGSYRGGVGSLIEGYPELHWSWLGLVGALCQFNEALVCVFLAWFSHISSVVLT